MQGPREAQQEARVSAAEQFASKYSTFSYDDIVASLKSNSQRVKRSAGNVLEQTGNQLDNVGQIPMTNTQGAIASARATLSRANVAGNKSALNILDDFTDPLSNPQTFSTLKENRTALSAVIDSSDPAIRSQLPSFAKAQLVQLRSAMTRDMDDFARTNLPAAEYGKWKRANDVYAGEAQRLTRTKLKAVLDTGDMTPESVRTMLFSAKPSEVQQLYRTLTPAGRQNARSAIISDVVAKLNSRANGFTPTSFANELKKYETQIGVFFKGNEGRQLEGLRRVLEATKRAQEAGVATPTGQEVVTLLAGGALFMEPTTTAGALGTVAGLARLYESAPVRNALLRLASVPPSGPAFDAALASAAATLTATMNELADQGSAEANQGQSRQ
jgi:hypothetical protein